MGLGMKQRALLIACTILLASCETIPVDRLDSSPPTLSVSLLYPERLSAEYGLNDPVRGPIDEDTPRVFIRLPRDDSLVVLTFSALDRESGISQINAYADVSYMCHTARDARPVRPSPNPDNAADPKLHLVAESPFLTPGQPVPDRVPPSRFTGVSLTLETLWRRGCVEVTGRQRHGYISGVVIDYRGQAWNIPRRRPANVPTERRGVIEVVDTADVNLAP